MKKKVRIYKAEDGGQMQQAMAQEQMMQQEQPQQGGQEEQMQQIMQMVQQMIQQGAQPVDAAIELLGQQIPPEIIMQIFVQMGMPEQDAQMAIQQAAQQQGATDSDPADSDPDMMQQQGMMRNGGMMYADGGPVDPSKFSFNVSNPYNVQDTTDERYQYPASAIDAVVYKTPEEAKAGLFRRENDASRTYFNNPDTGEMGEFVGDQDAYNDRFQDFSGERSRAIIGDTRFPAEGGFTRNNNFETAPYLNNKEARQYQRAFEEDLQNSQNKQNRNPLDRSQADNNNYALGGLVSGNNQYSSGGKIPRRLRSFNEGGDNQEMQVVMQQVQEMMQQGAQPQEIMQQLEAAVEQGQVSVEVAQQIMEQIANMQQSSMQENNAMMPSPPQEQQMMNPYAPASAEQQMAKFGGNLKKLLSRAYGGNAVNPGVDSKNYVEDRKEMFVNAVKNNVYKSALDDDFPSLGGNQMAYGGNLPTAVNGIEMKDGKLVINPKAYKSEADYKAAIYDWNSNPANKDQLVTNEMFTENKYSQQPDKNANYKYDETSGTYIAQPAEQKTNQFTGFAEGDMLGQDYQGNYVTRKDGSMIRIPGYAQNNRNPYSTINPVAYNNPMNNSLYDNLYAGASPFSRFMAGSGNRYGDPRLTGNNLPGGMNASQFLGAAGGLDKLTSGMTGTIGDQTWRIGAGEKFKEGSIFKGNRRKGVRYQIDWGNAAAMNPTSVQNNSNPSVISNPNYNSKSIEDKEAIDQGLQYSGQTNQPVVASNSSYQVDDNEYNPLAPKDNSKYSSLSSVVNQPSAIIPVSPTAVNPVVSNTEVTDEEVESGRKSNKYDRQSKKQVDKETKIETDESFKNYEDIVSEFDKKDAQSIRNNYNQMYQTYGKDKADEMMSGDYMNIKLKERNKKIDNRNKAYGGNVDPAALENAIALINRAFGGMIPRANNGLNLSPEDMEEENRLRASEQIDAQAFADANKPKLQENPFNNKGTIDSTNSKKLNINWDAAGDMYMNTAAKVTNFANKVNAYNPERDRARMSALNVPSDTYNTMQQGLYDQAGNYIPNDIGNQVLNPTNSNFNNQQKVFEYGGRVFEIGGEVDLDDNELAELAAAGFQFSKI